MCNAYFVQPKKDVVDRNLAVSKAVERLKMTLIRPTVPGLVVLDDEPAVMRWGFHRPFNKSINNTRADKLDESMWRKAFNERRCHIPVSGFYEWSGAKGLKRTHLFIDLDGGYLWVAGIWEESEELGRCYSMITTEANLLMKPIHNRMPAVLEESQHATYLSGGMDVFSPRPSLLKVEDTSNPLTKKPHQRELF